VYIIIIIIIIIIIAFKFSVFTDLSCLFKQHAVKNIVDFISFTR